MSDRQENDELGEVEPKQGAQDETSTDDTVEVPSEPPVMVSVVDGTVQVSGADGHATLHWQPEQCSVTIDGADVEGPSCEVHAEQKVAVTAHTQTPAVEYVVAIAEDRMTATLTVESREGIERTLLDAAEDSELHLQFQEERTPPPEPSSAAAMQALTDNDIRHGVDPSAAERAVHAPGSCETVAVGTDPIPGTPGSLALVVDLEKACKTGVEAETRLVRIVPRVDGIPGTDVGGHRVAVDPVPDAPLKLVAGTELTEDGTFVIATVDGAPVVDCETGHLEMQPELTLDVVDHTTGDVEFCGSLHVLGDVSEGRKVVVKHSLTVDGTVERADVTSGGDMHLGGAVIHSHVRAGGDRAVFAAVLDLVHDIPLNLGKAVVQAGELQQAAKERGQQLAFGLALTVVVERFFRNAVEHLREAAEQLHSAGGTHNADAHHFEHWATLVGTAANRSVDAGTITKVIDGIGEVVRRYGALVDSDAHLQVEYVQASEIEATGTVTVGGKGIYNSNVSARKGLHVESSTAVVRGGSIRSHGPVVIGELGSPGGATMQVALGAGASLKADRAYSGVTVVSPSGTHRFNRDSVNVHIALGDSGLNVESLAA